MIRLIGIPYDQNSSFLKGPSLAPARIRLMDSDGSANAFAERGIEIRHGLNYVDEGDLLFTNTEPAAAFALIKQKVRDLVSNGDRVISLGGDHSVSYPVIDAFSEKYPGLNILHLDAHADLYDNFDNNPFSHASPFARLMETGKINSLTQVGIRTLNTHQREQARRFNVRIIEMKDFNFHFIDTLPSPLYISLDLDVLDPAFAPGLSHHEPGGMSTRDLITVLQRLTATVVGADIVEYNPVRDVHNMTAMVAYKLFRELVSVLLAN